MKMKKLLFVALACGLSWSACAQEGLEKKQFTRVLPSDINQRVGFFTWLNPDCTAGGNVIIRLVKKPEHGTVEITPTSNYPG
jgi:hypothetical protein